VQLVPGWQYTNLAVFTWEPFGSGYRPKATGLLGAHAASVDIGLVRSVVPSPVGVTLTFAGQDARLWSDLTTKAASYIVVGQALPVPSQSQLVLFIGLTDSDIANWETIQQSVMRSLNDGGKLLADPVTPQPITSGQLFMPYLDLRSACSLTARPGS
jgi:hypothetical protein